jgi:fatty acid desaturase
VKLLSRSFYVRELRPALPDHVFAPVPSRLGWLALHVAIVVAGIYAIAHGCPLWLMPILSLVIGHSFAGCAFVAHETLHGAVVRDRWLRLAVGWLAFLPFVLSPRLWIAWHNRTHHAHTMAEGDPDRYPTLDEYRRRRYLRVADRFAVARARPLGIVTLLVGLSGQSANMLWRWSRDPEAMPPRARRLAIVEMAAGAAVWAALALALGPLHFCFAYVLPLLVANAIVVGYILTNHSLSPMTEINDPLVNSLTVTVPGWLARLHLDFGLHVEHHLFPSMSSAHAGRVRRELLARWPERYQSLPLAAALWRLVRTPRVYASATRLVDPQGGVEAATLGTTPDAPSPPRATSAPSLLPPIIAAPCEK